MIKDIYSGEDATRLIGLGVNNLANTVKLTLGPSGNNVLIENGLGEPQMTKDGVTVAHSINYRNSVERMAGNSLKMAAERTARLSGDGTTTTIALAQAAYNNLCKFVDDSLLGVTVTKSDIRDAFTKAHLIYQKYLLNHKIAINADNKALLYNICLTSSNNDIELSNKVYDLFLQTGFNGTILLEEGFSEHTTTELIDGVKYDNGWASRSFSNDQKSITLNNAYILVIDYKLETIESIRHILEDIIGKDASLLIVANDFDPVVLNILSTAVLSKGLKICCVKSPLWGEFRRKNLDDIAILTDTLVCATDTGYTPKSLFLEDLGFAERVVVTDSHFILFNPEQLRLGNEEALVKRIGQIKEDIEYSNPMNEWEINKHKERLSKFTGKVGVIKVGGITELDRKERRDRYDDVLKALDCSIRTGIVKGGGLTYIWAFYDFIKGIEYRTYKKDILFVRSVELLKNVLLSPLKEMCLNSGINFLSVNTLLLSKKRDNYFDFKHRAIRSFNGEHPIYDPMGVSESALTNAISVALGLFMTSAVIVDINSHEFKEMHDKLKNESPQ